MKKFEFSSVPQAQAHPTATFTGSAFYSIYKEAEFLRNSANIETILSRGYQLRQRLKKETPGEVIKVEGMNLEKNTPLLIRKTGNGVIVEDFEFTFNRLAGLVAAYAFDNRHRFPIIKSSEAITLGLTWDNGNEAKCRLYLSAVSGTEHFYDQFSFWPLVCAIKKIQLHKIPPPILVNVATTKNNHGVILAKDFMKNIAVVKKLWMYFPGCSLTDLDSLIASVPPQMKRLFFD
ncbi:uncharacterized protein LOC126370735 [Pectinophora gossypiella]|uniref:Uncharacterized protein n=1 Tax=Pectinophora gossypiella TaxID=13191 RepID=A0A1E1W0W3_PECGO|nr:uncharacterized protein LOC126370735 [Pectinophora gossypiella]